LMIAEESTAFPGVTQPVHLGGLGFTFKWNMGWMNDTLRYMELDPVHRSHEHRLVTFSFMYAWSERFLLPVSHDEVVHGKRALLDKMPGDEWQKRANYRLFRTYMTVHPGKKLLFMGCEFGQWREWRDAAELDWYLLDEAHHRELLELNRELNRLYASTAQLHASDGDAEGFAWSDLDNAAQSVFAFERRATGGEPGAPLLCVFNATPVPRDDYWVGVDAAGRYRKLLDSDDRRFGGSGYSTSEIVHTTSESTRGRPHTLRLSLPPLGALILQHS
jgi:1,4-alpha-glucan branching enzyme